MSNNCYLYSFFIFLNFVGCGDEIEEEFMWWVFWKYFWFIDNCIVCVDIWKYKYSVLY